jgi:phosphate transport system substrate-binding protein
MDHSIGNARSALRTSCARPVLRRLGDLFLPALLPALLTLLPAPQLAAQAAPAPLAAVCSYDMEPLILLWADQMQTLHPQFQLELGTGNAAQVAQALIDGKSRLAPINRELKPEELAAFQAKWGYPPTRMPFAVDALAILVPSANPIRSLSLAQLDALWTTSRRAGWPRDIAVWGDLGLDGEWAQRLIVCIERPDGDGIREGFQQAVTHSGQSKPSNRPSASAMAMVEALLASPGGISYGSMSEVFNQLRAVPILPKGSGGPVAPSFESVTSGTYPLTWVVNFYFNRAPHQPIAPDLLAFLRFVTSPQGQQQLRPMGLVPLPPDALFMANLALED